MIRPIYLAALALFIPCPAPAGDSTAPPAGLMGHRFLTLNTIVRVRQIEVTRDTAHGPDESSVHTPAEARAFREAIDKAWPGGRITWAFSWLALHDERAGYRELRELVAGYQKKFGDEVTFIPGAYFGPMYNTREQVNRDLHEGLRKVSEMVGNGYRPKSVVAGFLSAENLRHLAEEEGIHVCQGNIWSQYAVDNGDGEGSICYPYYPSREHFLKPARGKDDFIDCVNLDGWTVDFLCARIPGARTVDGERWRSRQGVGPIETLLDMGTERGLEAMMATTACHFDDGFARNGFAWVTCGWEMSLVEARKIYGYGGRNGMEGLHGWLAGIRERWPDAKLITQGEFGELWRARFKNNDELDYRFTHRGCGIRASEADKEIRWFMNRDFRLALLRDWKADGPAKVIDFTRYDLPAVEPPDPAPGGHSRNWSLMNRINQKQTRPQDEPVALEDLPADDRELIRRRHPELFDDAWRPLYRGTLDDFRIYFRGQGYIDDVNRQQVFRAKPEGIHVVKGTNGLLVTKAPYRDYHVKVDYRWGEKGGSMNAGLMTHVDLDSKLVKDNRPRSIEINMKADCPGSVWLGAGLGPYASTCVEAGTETFLPGERGGVAHEPDPFGKRTVFARYPEGGMNTRPHGEWNTLEAIVRGSESVEIILNGITVNRLTGIRDVSTEGKAPGDPLVEGGIGLQSEGQEIFYRNFLIRELKP